MDTHLPLYGYSQNHLSLVLQTLPKANFFKFSKCLFAQSTIEYLSHIICFDGVVPEKIKFM